MNQNPSNVRFEMTPNPSTIKFYLGIQVADQGFEVPSAQDTDRSPLAAKIFGFPWTSNIFVGTDFITVTKQDWVEWSILAEPLRGLIQEHLDRGEPVVVEIKESSLPDENDSPLVRQIKTCLDREIRPVVALDGGDIVFHSFENGVLAIKMKGACSGCPSSTATLKEGIEVRMRELFPEIQEVISV